MKRISLFFLLSALLLSACGHSPETKEASSDSTNNTISASSNDVSAESADLTPTVTPTPIPEETPSPTPEATPVPEKIDTTPQPVTFDESWEFASSSMIHTGTACIYKAAENRKDFIVGVNAGHGTEGGSSVRTYCHPDQSPKVTGGSTDEGSVTATACATGMQFSDGTPERDVTLAEALLLKDLLLENGYDVLMIREEEDVQLDNVARTVLCNNLADCHIALHWDGDGLDYDKGCFYMSVPEELKSMYPVSEIWEKDELLGECLIQGLSTADCKIWNDGFLPMDLTQTSYSKIPSVDIELGNAASDHSEAALSQLADGLLAGIEQFYLKETS